MRISCSIFFSFWPSFPWSWNGWSSRSSKKTKAKKDSSGNRGHRAPVSPVSENFLLCRYRNMIPFSSRSCQDVLSYLSFTSSRLFGNQSQLAPNPKNFSLKCFSYLYFISAPTNPTLVHLITSCLDFWSNLLAHSFICSFRNMHWALSKCQTLLKVLESQWRKTQYSLQGVYNLVESDGQIPQIIPPLLSGTFKAHAWVVTGTQRWGHLTPPKKLS